MTGTSPDLVVRIAANITALQADMASAAATIKTLETSQASASATSATWMTSLDGLGHSIEKGIGSPIATAKEGLLAFVETWGPAGVALAGAATVAAAVGGALYELAAHAAEAGEKTDEFALVTGTAIEKVGAIGATAIIAGSSLDGMQAMLTQMQRRLDETGEPAQKFNAALADLGINAAAFRAADPSDRINILSDGMQRSAGSTTLMTDALAIMGKSGVQNIKFLMENTEAVRAKAQELAYTWSHDDTEASNDFNHAVAELGVGVTTLSTAIGVALLPAMTKVVEGVERIGIAMINVSGIPGYVALFHALTGAMGETDLKEQSLLATMDTANRLFANAAKEGLNAADAATEVASKMLELGYREDAVATATGLATETVRALKLAMKEAATEADAYATVWAKITANSAAAGAGIGGISQAIQDLIVKEKSEGSSIQELAAAWRLAPQQIQQIMEAHTAGIEAAKKAITDLAAAQKAADAIIMTTYQGQLAALKSLELAREKSYGTAAQIEMLGQQELAEHALTAAVYLQLNSEKDRMTLIEAAGKRHAEITAQKMALEAQLTAIIGQAILTEVQAQAKLNAAWDAATGAVHFQTTAAGVLQTTLDNLAATKKAGVSQEAQIQQAYDTFTDSVHKEQDALTGASDALGTMGKSLGAIPPLVTNAASAMYGLIDTMKDYKQFGQDGWFGWAPTGAIPPIISLPSTPNLPNGAPSTGTWTPPKRALGGPVASDTPYMVGERGPELFVPSSAGSIVPNGAGGISLTQHIYVTQPLATPQAIARAVGDAQLQAMKNLGMRLPATV